MAEQPRKRKIARAVGPHMPVEYMPADVLAWQALQRGEAEPYQQKRALDWLIQQAAGTYEFQFYPTDRETAFSLGRAFVGQQVVKMLNLDATKLQRV
jgi:hypothetical protein